MNRATAGALWLAMLAASLVWAMTGNGQRAQAERAASRSLRIGGHVGSVVVRDMNADAKLDILAARLDAGTLSVYLGDGHAGFREAKGSPFAVGNQPEDLAVADFNGDGRPDVAVANHETDYLTVLFGDGTGGLALAPQSPVHVPSRPHPHGVAHGEFNGDGHPDLAVESRDEDTVLVLYGDGKGAFSRKPERLAVGRSPYWRLRAGDLNADGRHDLVTTNNEGASVSVLLADRGGGFRPAKHFSTAKGPFAVAIGDVNGDGRTDLAVAHLSEGGPERDLEAVTILLGRGDGAFTPAPDSPFQAGKSSTAVAIGDFDGDGIGDVAVANMGSDDVTVLLGGRSGLWPAKGSPFSVGKGPTSVALGDLNGDGRADIVTGNWGSGDVSLVLSPYQHSRPCTRDE